MNENDNENVKDIIRHFHGLDLGQKKDYTAHVKIEKRISFSNANGGEWTPAVYTAVGLDRIKGRSYTQLVEDIKVMMSRDNGEDCPLVVDYTGVGRPVFDSLRSAGLRPIPILITGGNSWSYDGGTYNVPKRDLSSTMLVLGEPRFKVSWRLKLAKIIQGEMSVFSLKTNPVTLHDTYGAWREGEHDDCILACSIACWYAEREPEPPIPMSDADIKKITGGISGCRAYSGPYQTPNEPSLAEATRGLCDHGDDGDISYYGIDGSGAVRYRLRDR